MGGEILLGLYGGGVILLGLYRVMWAFVPLLGNTMPQHTSNCETGHPSANFMATQHCLLELVLSPTTIHSMLLRDS